MLLASRHRLTLISWLIALFLLFFLCTEGQVLGEASNHCIGVSRVLTGLGQTASLLLVGSILPITIIVTIELKTRDLPSFNLFDVDFVGEEVNLSDYVHVLENDSDHFTVALTASEAIDIQINMTLADPNLSEGVNLHFHQVL